jgi:hypothetical protein
MSGMSDDEPRVWGECKARRRFESGRRPHVEDPAEPGEPGGCAFCGEPAPGPPQPSGAGT